MPKRKALPPDSQRPKTSREARERASGITSAASTGVQRRDPRGLGRVGVILSEDHTWFADTLIGEINRKHRLVKDYKLSRSDLVRALLDALKASGIDLTSATTEGELRELLTDAMTPS